MYPIGIVLFILTCCLSAPGGLMIRRFLSGDPSNDNSLAYVVGLIVTMPALVPAAIATALFFKLRRDARFQKSVLARWFWLPVFPPALVILGLHLMLLVEPSDPNPCPPSLPNVGDSCNFGVKGCTYGGRTLLGVAHHTYKAATTNCWCTEGKINCNHVYSE